MYNRQSIFSLDRGLLLPLLILFFVFSAPATTAEKLGLAGRGKEVFETKCVACHTIGGGNKVGPDLQGINEKMPKEWLVDFISDPEKMFSANNPAAVKLLSEYKMKMPNLGLSKDDVSAVLDFLGSQREESQQSTRTAETPQGDAAAGKMFFTGAMALKNGGAPCISCHSVARIGFLGGGNLGPDLTQIYSSLGDGILSVLANIPFPTMVPVFKGHPITPEEARDLAAFLKETAVSQPQNFTPRVVITAIIGFLVLMIVISFAWRNRLVSVRAAMVKSSRDPSK